MNETTGNPSEFWGAHSAPGWVTVLLILMTGHSASLAKDTGGPALALSRFSCEVELPIGRGHLEGLMLSDGPQRRIALYWLEPDVFRDSASFLHYSDFIVASDRVHYWIHPGTQQGTFLLSDNPGVPLLPRDNSVESVVRRALAVVSRIRAQPPGQDGPLEVGTFFRSGRALADHEYEAAPGVLDGNGPRQPDDSDERTLNALPAGRRYSKQTRSDGSLMWRVMRGIYPQPVATVTIEPATRISADGCPDGFEPGTLGRWRLVPEPYRIYWSFDLALAGLSQSADQRSAGAELCDRIESYLGVGEAPPLVRLAMNRLRVKAALTADDLDRVRRSVQALATELSGGASLTKYRAFLELARIGGQVEERYPQQPLEWLRPLVGQTARQAAREVGTYVNRLLPTIEANGWFAYGALLLDEVRRQGLMEEDALKQTAARFEAMRVVRNPRPPDPCEPSARVREYLRRIEADPPRGPLDIGRVRHILEQGLAKYGKNQDAARNRRLVEDIIRSVRLIVGDGPFCANEEELTAATMQFVARHSTIYGDSEPIDTVLATFLALSFCDTSTPEDHTVLVAQFHRQCLALAVQVDTMLIERGLGSLVDRNAVERAFDPYERVFRQYVEDPLWPAFKFPLTSNEEARLASAVKPRLIQLTSVLDEISLKIKYGGANPQLKARTIYEIKRVAQGLLPEAAFLRKPKYPGVSLHYRTQCGFTATIERPLYLEGGRPKERFQAMKYFHLGHRLEEILKRELRFARSDGRLAQMRTIPDAPEGASPEAGVTHEAGGSDNVDSSPPNDE